jgi:tRNA-2-methylthio-N6-dimethylallyladenosine synthase
MDDQLSGAVKNERLRRLIKVQNAITCEINDASIGGTYEVLVEGVSPKDPERVSGLTRQNKTVNFIGEESMTGKLVKVRVTEGHLYGFVGDVVPGSLRT